MTSNLSSTAQLTQADSKLEVAEPVKDDSW